MNTNGFETALEAVRHERTRSHSLYNLHLSARDAWFGAAIAAMFNALGMLLELAIIQKIPGVSAKPAVISSLVGWLLLIVLLIRRKRPSVRLAGVVYLINTASVATFLLISNPEFAKFQGNWVPFQATKLGCLIAAMVAPGFWVGLVSIFAYSLSAVVQFELFFPKDIRMRIDSAEPWPILAFALAGVLALLYRFRRAQLEQEIARIEAQNFAIKRLAHAFLNIRDLMNTPLQVIDMSVDVLRKSNDPNRQTIDRIERAIQSLREINSVLIRHEKEIEWEAKQ
jgi:hypothetical protein